MGRRGGKLTFKGEGSDAGDRATKRKKKKQDKKKTSKSGGCDDDFARGDGVAEESHHHDDDEVSGVRTASSAASSAASVARGTGKITVSGTVVTGHDGSTKFTRELDVGDAILLGEEMRVVTMLLSDSSLNLSSGFSSNVDTSKPSSFRYVKKPSHQSDAERKRKARELERERDEHVAAHAFGTYASKGGDGGAGSKKGHQQQELVYRERTEHGSYRIKREKVSKPDGVTRTDLLEMRLKKKSDKYC